MNNLLNYDVHRGLHHDHHHDCHDDHGHHCDRYDDHDRHDHHGHHCDCYDGLFGKYNVAIIRMPLES